MPFGLGASNSRRRRANSTYVAPPVLSSYGSVGTNATYVQSRSSSMNNLSGLAAAAALRNHLNGPSLLLLLLLLLLLGTTSRGGSRANSLSNRTFRPPLRQQQQPVLRVLPQRQQQQQLRLSSQSRANSLNSLSKKYIGQQITQQRDAYSRSSSMNSNTPRLARESGSGGIAETTVTTRQGKDPNTVIKTTRQLGYDGRTKSLTKQTITKMGSFEVVKTTTIKPPNNQREMELVKPPSAPSAFYAGSLLSTGDSELENIAEEFDMDYYEEERFQAVEEEDVEDEYIEEEVVKEVQHIPIPLRSPQRSPPQHSYRQLTQNNVNQLNNSTSNYRVSHNSLSSNGSGAAAAVPIKSILKSKTSGSLLNGSSVDQYHRARDIQPRKIANEAMTTESTSGDSVYSDAYDMLPSASTSNKYNSGVMRNEVVESDSLKSAPRSSLMRQQLSDGRNNSMTSSTQKSVRIDLPQSEYKNRHSTERYSTDRHGNGATAAATAAATVTPRAAPKHEATQEEMYLKALEIAKQKVYGDRLPQTMTPNLADEDEGYNSDSSFTRMYPKPTLKERASSLTSHSLGARRAMSLTSASRTMSGQSISGVVAPSQYQNGGGFRTHSLRAQENPMMAAVQEPPKKTKMMDSIIRRSPSMAKVEGKHDKKWEKKQRKEEMRLLEQERKDAVDRAAEAAGLNRVKTEANVAQEGSSPSRRASKLVKSSTRFSIFGKKKKDQEVERPQISDPILQTAPEQNSTDVNDNNHFKAFPYQYSTSGTPVRVLSNQRITPVDVSPVQLQRVVSNTSVNTPQRVASNTSINRYEPLQKVDSNERAYQFRSRYDPLQRVESDESYRQNADIIDDYRSTDRESNAESFYARRVATQSSTASPLGYIPPVAEVPEQDDFHTASLTPVLTSSIHQLDENSSEPKTIADHSLDAGLVNVNPYEDYASYETLNGYQEATAMENASGTTEIAHTESKKKSNGHSGNGKRRGKKFGKKVLKWFDIED